MEQVIDQNKPKTDRPTGIWILTIYAVIFAGNFPIIVAGYLMMSDFNPPQYGSSTASFIFAIVLGVSVIISAIGAWKGNNKARIALMILITLYYVLVGINNASLLRTPNAIPSDMQPRIYGRIFRGVLYPAAYIWYFLRAETRRFYTPRADVTVE